MRYLHSLVVAGGVALLVLLASCSDPTDAGLGVGPDSLRGGEPQLETVFPDPITVEASPPVTGFANQEGGFGANTWRFLVGAVSDYGRIEADGYFDVSGRGTWPDLLLTATADSVQAEIRLETEYVHGDTVSNVPIQVAGLTAEADMEGAPSDTIFEAGSVIGTDNSHAPTDSLVTISLPQSWVSDNLALLRDTTDDGENFEANFHGFRLSASDAEAVVGFDHGSAVLRLSLRGGGSFADYTAAKSFTNVERTTDPSLPPDRLLIQDGVGRNLVFRWDEARIDSLRGAPLNDASILLPTDPDSSSLADRGASFARPSPTDFRLTGLRTPDAPRCTEILASPLTEAGDECALPLLPNTPNNTIRVDQTTALAVLEATLRSEAESVFSEYRVEVTDREGTDANVGATLRRGLPSTIPVLVPTPDATDADRPRLELIVTPI